AAPPRAGTGARESGPAEGVSGDREGISSDMARPDSAASLIVNEPIGRFNCKTSAPAAAPQTITTPQTSVRFCGQTPPPHRHPGDLGHDLVAEPIALPRVLAEQHVLAVDEAVVVVGHARDVHQAVDEVLDELHEQPERRHPDHVALELLADLVGHEADLLPLD